MSLVSITQHSFEHPAYTRFNLEDCVRHARVAAVERSYVCRSGFPRIAPRDKEVLVAWFRTDSTDEAAQQLSIVPTTVRTIHAANPCEVRCGWTICHHGGGHTGACHTGRHHRPRRLFTPSGPTRGSVSAFAAAAGFHIQKGSFGSPSVGLSKSSVPEAVWATSCPSPTRTQPAVQSCITMVSEPPCTTLHFQAV